MAFEPNTNQGQTNVPPPPTPEVALRTLASDAKAISRGETTPTPEILTPPSAQNEPVFTPETSNPGGLSVDGLAAPKKSSKMIIWVAVAVIVIGGLGYAGYTYLLPMFQNNEPIVIPVPETNTPVPEVPVAEVPTALVHTSLFLNAPAGTTNLSFPETLTRTVILETMKLSSEQAATGALTELVMNDSKNEPLAFSSFLAGFVPSFTGAPQAINLFDADFTAFVYKDANGSWPGYIAHIKPNVDTTGLATWLASLEGTTLSEFFLTDPGEFSAFKEGKVNNTTDRYATAKMAGASFGIAATDTHVIIATSYSGMKEAFKLLGL